MAIDTPAPAATLPPEKQWPAVALAYEFVRPSYDVMLKRFEIVEGRARGLIALAASVTFGAPVFATAARGPMLYTSGWLLAALGCALFIVILGTAVFIGKRVDVADPDSLYATAMDDDVTTWAFQRWALSQAGIAFHANNRVLERKGLAIDAMGVILVVELVCMAIWVISA